MRLLVLSISFLYLSFSSGITVSSHYCMGLLKNVEFGSHHFKCCCAEFMAMMDDDCCDDEEKVYKLSDDQSIAQYIDIPANDLVIQINQSFELDLTLRDEDEFRNDIRPPPDISTDRLKMCSLIFYS